MNRIVWYYNIIIVTVFMLYAIIIAYILNIDVFAYTVWFGLVVAGSILVFFRLWFQVI